MQTKVIGTRLRALRAAGVSLFLSPIGAFGFATPGFAKAEVASTPQYGADTRALHFFADGSGTHYAGGYLNDLNERDTTPDGNPLSTLDVTFSGRQQVGQIYNGTNYSPVYVPASAHAYANADLATGKLRVYATDPAFPIVNGPDTYITFNQSRTNASFTDLLSFDFDPAFTADYFRVGIRVGLDGSFTSLAPNGSGTIKLTLDTSLSGQEFLYSGSFGQNSGVFTNLTSFGSNVYGFDVSLSRANPSFSLRELLSANAYGGTTDYSHTATTSLVLPQGVSYRSASGVFLSGDSTPAVPEPATWASMIAGFGLLGGALRRRRFRPALV